MLLTGFGDYKFKSFGQIDKEARALASYLMKHDLCPKVQSENGTFGLIGLYAKNREEWVVTDIASILAGFASVTLYDTLGKEFIEYIMNQTELKTLVLSLDKIVYNYLRILNIFKVKLSILLFIFCHV